VAPSPADRYVAGPLRWLTSADWFSALAALVVLVVVIGVLHPDFVSHTQLANIAQQSVYVGLMAAGMIFLLTQGEVDLSVGGNYVLASVTAALFVQSGMSTWLAALIALVVSSAVGAINATIVQVVGIPSLIATLAMGWVLHGLASAISEGKQIVGMPVTDSFFNVLGGGSFLGLSTSVWLLIATVAILTIVLRKTPFGFRVREIGSNPDAAQFAGIPIGRSKTSGFLLSSFLSGMAGILGLAFFTSGDPTSGGGFELFAVAGAVIGGNPLTGGTATVFGAVIGVLLLNAVSVGLVYLHITAVWSQFATGAIIIVAVSLNGLIQRGRRRRA
jgi:ribose/xylose/arabinose/galactoside ABC-type transport system permease subunit